MCEIVADLDALTAAGEGIAGLVEELHQQPVDDIDCDRAAVGHSGLAEKLGTFCERWQVGVSSLATDGTETAAFLQETVHLFGATDQASADELLGVSPDG